MRKNNLQKHLIVSSFFEFSSLLICLILFSAGCHRQPDQTQKLTHFNILLDWQAEPTYIGVYYAKDLGLFRELGLDVNIIQSWGANAAVAAVAGGQYEIATASGGATVLGFDKTTNIVSLGVVYPEIPTVIYGLSSTELIGPESLKGKKIGVYPGSITVNELNAFISINKLNTNDFTITSISGADIPLLKSHSVDCVLHYYEMSPVAVETSSAFPSINGKRTSDLRLARYGVKGYGLNVVTSKSALAKDHDLLIKVSAAIFEGYRKACENPDAAAAAFCQEFPDKDPGYVKESLKRVCSMISGNYGDQTEQGWEQTIDVYKNQALLTQKIRAKDLLP